MRKKKMGEEKVGKVMKEFGAGKLRSGSKTGPKVTSPRQAKAIAMSEAGLSRPRRGGGGGSQRMRDMAMLKRKQMG